MSTPTFSATRELRGFPFRVIAFEMSAMLVGDTATALILKDRMGNVQTFVKDPILLHNISTGGSNANEPIYVPCMTTFDGSTGSITLVGVPSGGKGGGQQVSTAVVLTCYVLLMDHGYGLGA